MPLPFEERWDAIDCECYECGTLRDDLLRQARQEIARVIEEMEKADPHYRLVLLRGQELRAEYGITK